MALTSPAATVVVELLRVAVGLVLGVSGWAKLLSPSTASVSALGDLAPIGPDALWWLAAALPGVEIVVGWSLVLGMCRRPAVIAALALGVTFTSFHALVALMPDPPQLARAGCACLGGAFRGSVSQGVGMVLALSVFLPSAAAWLIERRQPSPAARCPGVAA